MIRINLLREGRGGKRAAGGGPRMVSGPAAPAEGGPPWGIWVTLVLLTVVVTLGYGAWLVTKNRSLALQISQQQEELKKYEGAREKVAELEKKKQEYTAKVDQIKQLKDQQSVPVKLMNKLVEVLPDGAWYVSVAQGPSGQISIDGRAKGIKTISMLYDNLVAAADFTGVQLGDVAQVGSSSEDVYSFRISCTYAASAPKPVAPAAAPPPPPRRKPAQSSASGME
ncbi:MAG: PilN domain-containing protein [Acidobacteriota bacterium]